MYKTLSDLTRHLKTDFVFYNPKTLKPYYGLNKAFDRALKKAHIADFRIHDLRHTFASRLVMAGVDLTTVKDYWQEMKKAEISFIKNLAISETVEI